MSGSIKLKHASGNGVIISAPSSNPAADRTLLLPSNSDSTIDTLNRTGNVLQVVYGTHATQVISTSGTYVDTGLSKSITPLQTGSNIYVLVEQHIMVARNNDGVFGAVKIVQDSTDRFVNAVSYQMGVFADSVSEINLRLPITVSSFHAHGVNAGTSTTYKTQMLNHQTSNSGQIVAQQGNSTSTITIMEISA